LKTLTSAGVAACVLVAACGPSLAVRSPSAPVQPFDARWVVTHPELSGVDAVAIAADDIYVLDCASHARIIKVAAGYVVWSHAFEEGCAEGHHEHALAADAGGVAVVVGANVIVLDPAGTLRWRHELGAPARDVALAAGPDRFAACFATTAVELDDQGTAISTHPLGKSWAAERCSYDARGALWIVVRGAAGPGTSAVRAEPRRIFGLSRSEHAVTLPTPTGFVVADAAAKTMRFVDLEGKQRWQLDYAQPGCQISPDAIAASPTSLVASVAVRCDERGATAGFGDVEIEDRTESNGPLVERTIVVALDMMTRHARMVRTVGNSPRSAKYALLAHGTLVYGHFQGDFGLGTTITSGSSQWPFVASLATR
jgi:hypothetical protein